MVTILGTETLVDEDGNPITISIVAEEQCPICHQAGNPKVWDINNVCWWKCHNPACPVGYYQPETQQVELGRQKFIENSAAIDATLIESWNQYAGELKH